jgi:hypothetical protein
MYFISKDIHGAAKRIGEGKINELSSQDYQYKI